MEISNKLISEVTGKDCVKCDIKNSDIINQFDHVDMDKNVYWYEKESDTYICKNLYEFIHKDCKDWAKDKGFVIGVDLDNVNIWNINDRKKENHYEVYYEDYLEFKIKACEWILNEM